MPLIPEGRVNPELESARRLLEHLRDAAAGELEDEWEGGMSISSGETTASFQRQIREELEGHERHRERRGRARARRSCWPRR
jgi:hypothetical protein